MGSRGSADDASTSPPRHARRPTRRGAARRRWLSYSSASEVTSRSSLGNHTLAALRSTGGTAFSTFSFSTPCRYGEGRGRGGRRAGEGRACGGRDTRRWIFRWRNWDVTVSPRNYSSAVKRRGNVLRATIPLGGDRVLDGRDKWEGIILERWRWNVCLWDDCVWG